MNKKEIRISFSAPVPVEATAEQIREWVTFSLHQGSMRTDNPLSNFDLDAIGHITISEAA